MSVFHSLRETGFCRAPGWLKLGMSLSVLQYGLQTYEDVRLVELPQYYVPPSLKQPNAPSLVHPKPIP